MVGTVPLWGLGLKVPLGMMHWDKPINPKFLWWGLCLAPETEEGEQEEGLAFLCTEWQLMALGTAG